MSSNNNKKASKSPAPASNGKPKAAAPPAVPPTPPTTTTTTTTTTPTPSTSSSTSNSSSKPNAWSKPLAVKTPPPPPGYTAQDGTATNGGSLTPEDESLRLAHRERALHMWLNLVGHKVVLTLTDATVVEGILHTATPLVMAKLEERNQYVLKAVRVVQQPTTGTAPAGSTWLVAMDRVVQMHVKSLAKTATNGRAAFTDTEISGAMAGSSAKDLQEAGSAWTTAPKAGGAALNSRAEALGGGTPAAVETKVGLAGSIGQWDQFKANETLFNVKGSYDENLYTTELDKTALSAAAKAKAARLAKEIEGTASTNWHVAEERGQKVQGDFDEEDLYSGVLKTSAVPAAAAAAPGMSYAKVAKSSAEEKQEVLETAVAAVKIEADAKVEDTPVVTPPPVETVAKVETKKEEKPAAAPEEKKDAPKSTKLSANAKSFSLNFNAKSFTPTFESAPAAEVPPVPLVDPNTGMPLAHVPPGGAAYMQQPQQGMIPMMAAPPYGRYPGHYPGMEHHMQMQQQQPQPAMQASARTSTTASPVPEAASTSTVLGGGEEEGESVPPAQVQPPQEAGGPAEGGPPQQQQPNPQSGPTPQQMQAMPYGMHPPQAYYNPQMGMPPRGPVAAYPQHMMPQQMPNPMQYRQMYQIQPHPNMMSGPMSYYPQGGQMAYPNYYEEDMGYRGGGGGGGGGGRAGGRAGRTGRAGGRAGRTFRGGRDGRGNGRGRFHNQHQNNHYGGRSHQQEDHGRQAPAHDGSEAAPAPATSG